METIVELSRLDLHTLNDNRRREEHLCAHYTLLREFEAAYLHAMSAKRWQRAAEHRAWLDGGAA